MTFREATIQDIKQIQIVRNSVKENTLSDPNLVPDKDVENYISNRGKGWVCDINDKIVGFSIVDLKGNNIWALFVDPRFEKLGIGRKLHDMMLNWYFSQTDIALWLGTSPNTRAEQFYKKACWKVIGTHAKGEVKFEMTAKDWKNQQ